MPYDSISDLPKSQVDQYDRHEKKAFLEAFNHAYHEYGGDESRAFAVAHAAAKKAGAAEHRSSGRSGSSRRSSGSSRSASSGRSSSGRGRSTSSSRSRSGAHAGGKVNINRASADELMQVDGIGPSTARHIVDYRSRHGRFGSVNDLEQVSGIGDATLRDIRGDLTT